MGVSHKQHFNVFAALFLLCCFIHWKIGIGAIAKTKNDKIAYRLGSL